MHIADYRAVRVHNEGLWSIEARLAEVSECIIVAVSCLTRLDIEIDQSVIWTLCTTAHLGEAGASIDAS